MPSPIAHAAAGIAIHVLARDRDRTRRSTGLLLGVCVGLSLLPDADAAVGIVLGDLGRYHNNFAGSPAFGLLVALVVGVLVAVVRRDAARGAAWLTFICYQVHVWMDFMTVSRGIMLLWPFTDTRFHPPFHVFYGVRWSDGLFSPRHFITIGTELATVAVVYFVLQWVSSWVARRRAASTA